MFPRPPPRALRRPTHFGLTTRSLAAEYAAGTLHTITEIVHADLFSDFIEMARHLLAEGYKDASAVIAGSTLESHLRQLCAKHQLQTTNPSGQPIRADRLNADLGRVAYGMLDQKQITAWLDLRNDAKSVRRFSDNERP